MKIAIISDTHENEPAIIKAVKIIKEMNVDIVLHCGDLISPPMVDYFKEFKDFRLVFGNNDGEKEGLKRRCREHGFLEPKEVMEFEISGKKFIMAHEMHKVHKHINSGKYDYILYGHSHVQNDEIIGKTRVINPGALFRVPYYTFAIIDPENDELDFYKV